MSDAEKFLVVKKYVDECDAFSLLAGGAPRDEYDVESIRIAECISKEDTSKWIAAVIAGVMSASFDEDVLPGLLIEAAEKIRYELREVAE